MAHHALGAGDGDLVGLRAEDLLDGQRFDLVVHLGAGAVGVDVVDVVGFSPASAKAIWMQAMAPRPSGWVSVMRKASAVEP